MMHSTIESALTCVVGAVEVVSDTNGATFHRSPGQGRTRLGDPGYDFMSAVPSGVRVAALTDAVWLEIDVELSKFLFPGFTSPGSAFDVVIDGHLREPVWATEENLIFVDPATGGTRIQPAGPSTVRFDLGEPAGERRVEIWFPSGATLKLLDVRISSGASLRPAPAQGPLWVHHGSSISQCSEVDRPTDTWPAIVARTAGQSLMNLGVGGQCHLDQFMARMIRDLPADAISLELGINVVNADSMRERAFVSAFHGFLDTVREGHPDTPILVITPILCPVAEHRPGPTLAGPDLRVHTVERPAEQAVGALTLTRIRELLEQHVEHRRKEGDTRLHVIDGLGLFGPEDAEDLPDGLHPNAAGYRRMAERFMPVAFGPEGGYLQPGPGPSSTR
jgi:lysophospholipase L1-like esterase